ncbi:hypothetical protein JXB28_04670 [Candidatus Woesearchaeota archaeon]|nr:hypothetical protein [Candidatus Woesearchaeota archaeon]
MARKKKPMKEEDLRKLAEAVLDKGWDKISTTAVVATLGHSFYHRHCKGEENMQSLLQKIRELDPDKYGHLRYVRIHKDHFTRQPLRPGEEDIISDMILKSYEQSPWRSEGPPLDVIKSIRERLEQAGFQRSEASIRGHAQKIWEGKYRTVEGLPQYLMNPRPRAKAEEDVAENLERILGDFKKQKKDKFIDGVINSDDNDNRAREYLYLAGRGHQALVAYMMDPKNYKNILRSDFDLVAVDFTKANTPPDLFEKCKDNVELLEEICKQEGGIVSFVDSWLRCDMVFRDGDGNYHVAEIKQNAVNHNLNGRKGYPNADKVVEQIGAYTGGLQARIEWINRNRPEGKKIPEQVHGIVIAYAIDDELYDYLIDKDNLRPIKVSKRAVGSYLKGLPGKEDD